MYHIISVEKTTFHVLNYQVTDEFLKCYQFVLDLLNSKVVLLALGSLPLDSLFISGGLKLEVNKEYNHYQLCHNIIILLFLATVSLFSKIHRTLDLETILKGYVVQLIGEKVVQSHTTNEWHLVIAVK